MEDPLVMEVVDPDKQLWEVKAARAVILVFRFFTLSLPGVEKLQPATG